MVRLYLCSLCSLSVLLITLALAPPAQGQTVILYQNDFESPNQPIVRNCGFALDGTPINTVYGTPDFTFAQTNTVETVLINDPQYSNPQGTGDAYAIGMLSAVQDDRLGLNFDVQGKEFLNISMDISAIDVNGCGGPFGVAAPQYVLSLYDNPDGLTTINGNGVLLDQQTITGTPPPDQWTFDWSNHIVALDASNATNDFVTVQWDLVQSGYAAFDNLIIAASDDEGQVNNDPVAEDDMATTDEGVPVVIDVLDNDSDPDEGQTLTVSAIVTDPAEGTATINPDGTVTYSPDPGFSGDDSFEYELSDGAGGADTATVRITVNPDGEETDSTPPECSALQLSDGPFGGNLAAFVTAQDAESGIAKLTYKLKNASGFYDAGGGFEGPFANDDMVQFDVPVTGAITIGGEKMNPGKRARVVVLVENGEGLVATCDPVMTSLDGEQPAAFGLDAAYPNPFNPTTTLAFAVPEAAHVELAVYDVLGRRVATLVSETVAAGRYEVQWDARSDAGEPVAGGVYLVRLVAGSFVQTQQLTLVK